MLSMLSTGKGKGGKGGKGGRGRKSGKKSGGGNPEVDKEDIFEVGRDRHHSVTETVSRAG